MTKTLPFDVTAGSVLGARHLLLGTNNQDAIAIRRLADGRIVCVVCDGCSAGQNSEFGARLLAELVITALARTRTASDRTGYWPMIEADVLAELRGVLHLLGGVRYGIARENLLATIVGCVVDEVQTQFFRFGDGVLCVNGAWTRFENSIANRPDYIAYRLFENGTFEQESGGFEIAEVIATRDLRHAVLGTDGVDDLIEAAGTATIPNTDETVHPVSALWERAAFFGNPFLLGRYLRRLNPLPPSKNRGLLRDDTSLVVLRRAEGGKEAE